MTNAYKPKPHIRIIAEDILENIYYVENEPSIYGV